MDDGEDLLMANTHKIHIKGDFDARRPSDGMWPKEYLRELCWMLEQGISEPDYWKDLRDQCGLILDSAGVPSCEEIRRQRRREKR